MRLLSKMIFGLALALSFSIGAMPASAHKVIASAYADGNDIEGEIGFSNGDMAADVMVEILDDDGKKLGETKTDEEGIFRFTPTSIIPLTFKADLGQGHVAVYRMAEDELPQIEKAADRPNIVNASQVKPQGNASLPSDSGGQIIVDDAMMQLINAAMKTELAQLKSELRAAVRLETKPLRKEIAAYKEKNDLQTILGGIGYIIGLFGIGFYIAARREASKIKASAAIPSSKNEAA